MKFFERDFGDEDFKKGDINVKILKELLKIENDNYDVILRKFNIERKNIDSIDEEDVIDVFNDLMEWDIFFSQIDTVDLIMTSLTREVLKKANEALAYGKNLPKKAVRVLNRGIIHSLFPQATVRARQHKRFSDKSLFKTAVKLKPLPPFFGDPIEGYLTNLSAGGMALFLNYRYPRGTMLNLDFKFIDQSQFQTIVKIKHASKNGEQYLHGIEFQEIPDYMATKIEKMAADYLACESRIENRDPKVCDLDCSYFNMCSKPQKFKEEN